MAKDRPERQHAGFSAAGGTADSPEPGPAAGLASILLVDDDDLNRALVRTALARSADPLVYTAQLFEAAGLASARALLAERPVDLVLLDMRLPDGSGLELAAELKPHGQPDPPAVIALTGALEPHMRSAAMAAGCTAALGKPYSVASLCELVHAELCRRPGRPAGPGRPASLPGTAANHGEDFNSDNRGQPGRGARLGSNRA